jgi:septum site-determining protein MinC
MARRPAVVVPEAACEIKFGQVGIAQLKLRDDDADVVFRELSEKVASAPQLFARAAICVDFSSLSRVPSVKEADAILAAIRNAGMIPVALAYGTTEITELAEALGLPILAKFRAAYEPVTPRSPAATVAAPPDAPSTRAAHVDAAAVDDYLPRDVVARAQSQAQAQPQVVEKIVERIVEKVVDGGTAQVHSKPVRSGQRVYAKGRDLIVHEQIGAGAEVIADGSVHIYAPLRGRALAGAQGDVNARIYCLDFQAELVAIAGQYKVFEEIPAEFRGKPVQIVLDGGQIVLSKLG